MAGEVEHKLVFVANTKANALRAFICSIEAFGNAPLPEDRMQALVKKIRLVDVGWPAEIAARPDRLGLLFRTKRELPPRDQGALEETERSQTFEGPVETSENPENVPWMKTPIDFEMEFAPDVAAHFFGNLPIAATWWQKLRTLWNGSAQAEPFEPRATRYQADFRAFSEATGEAGAAFFKEIEEKGPHTFVLVDDSRDEDSENETERFHRSFIAYLRNEDRVTEVRNGPAVLVVAFGEALLLASFMSRPKSGAEVAALLEADALGNRNPFMAAGFYPIRSVHLQAYRDKNFALWKGGRDVVVSKRPVGKDRPEVRVIDFDTFGFDLPSGEIARLPFADTRRVFGLSTLFGPIQTHAGDMIHVGGNTITANNKSLEERWRPYRSAAILLAALVRPRIPMIGGVQAKEIWFKDVDS